MESGAVPSDEDECRRAAVAADERALQGDGGGPAEQHGDQIERLQSPQRSVAAPSKSCRDRATTAPQPANSAITRAASSYMDICR